MEKLKSLYVKKSLANKLYIKKRIFTLKMVECSSLDKYIDEFNQVCKTFAKIDKALDDEGKALLLISSLPDSYNNFVNALMYGRQTLSSNEVKSALNTRYLQEKQGNLDYEAKGSLLRVNMIRNQRRKRSKGRPKIRTRLLNISNVIKRGILKDTQYQEGIG